MTTVLVATTGGHLTQLHRLASRVDVVDDERIWVTHRNPQSQSLLLDEHVEYVPYIEERDLAGVARSMAHARRLFREVQPSAVVSTGSAIAVGYLAVSSAQGIPSFYIESAARPGSVSRTGRILSHWPRVRTFTQYPQRVDKRWEYAGSVFDDFEPFASSNVSGAGLRVVVTTGSTEWRFDRLVRQIERIAPPDARILWQIGEGPHPDVKGDIHDFLPAEELSRRMAEADAVIAHAGCGSALSALAAGRAPVLVPREAAHGEVGDDHQPELAALLAGRGLALHRSVADLTWEAVAASARIGVRTAGLVPELRLAS